MKYYISVCMNIKEEGAYIKEFIDYHLTIGIEHFYIIDNESTDNTYDVLKPYVKKGLITYRKIKCDFLQQKLDMIKEFQDETHWMALIDADEYLLPMDGRSLKDILKDYEEFSGLAINWIIFGSSGFEARQESILKSYVNRSDCSFSSNKHIKSIVNPRKVKGWRDPHSWIYSEGFAVNENKEPTPTAFNDYTENVIRINHYYTKSKEDWEHKMKRGTGDCNVYNLDVFNFHDRNDVYDDIILRSIKC